MKKLKNRFICEYAGYGKNDSREGSHLKKQSNKDIVSTITCLVHFNKVIVEVYEDEEEKTEFGHVKKNY